MTKVWLVTGASSGFGRAIAEAVVAAGDIVVAAARRTGPLDDLVAAHPGQVEALRLDVTDTAGAQAAVDGVVAKHGRIDVLVNNAGRGVVGAVEETTDAELRELMDLHFFGPVALTRAALPHMRRQGSGAIVQLTSMGGRFAFAGVGAYCGTKFALEGLSESLAAEVAPHGIRVLIVEPGAFRTSFAGAGALSQSEAMDAYQDTVGPVRAGLSGGAGQEAGDPAKAAAAILTALDAPEPPLRLLLGNDAADAVSGSLERDRAEFRAWEKLTRSTDFDS
ncbi:oxidoreductase [Streptacidiphilus fuscans]|uniref:SDR family NAD(P)-dependent oxidoreductase n=1 Tax=Streptacidiphilus fuscans TaxID=2789292 RepID=A0A931AWN6_9ACTN|nr:oxidoreductase [Streptacidiphilus fuscans]MBF9066880.1 SDR family NAD(P)-dependent oxidoreductase [Streptacidiphilus fuscans]